MKISGIEAIPIDAPLGYERRTKYGIVKSRPYVIVKVHTDDGITGLGECTNFAFWGESQGTTVHIIRDYMPRLIIGEDPFDIEKILEKMDILGAGCNYPLYPYAKSAIDIALCDIMGKALNVPIYKLLGGCYRKEVPMTGIAAILETDEQLTKEIKGYLEKGFKCVKTKAGIDPEKDVHNVKVIREAVGEGMLIIVDPNTGYSKTTAVRTIRRMEKYGPLIVEQPIAAWDIDGMAAISRAVETPLMADESLWSPQDAIRIIKKQAADVFHVYDDKAGGLYRAKQVALIAEAEGIPIVVGEEGTGIGTAAAVHYVAATKNVSLPCQIVGPLFLADDIVKEPFRYVNGCLRVPEKPGLGIELDEAKLKKYTSYEGYAEGIVKAEEMW